MVRASTFINTIQRFGVDLYTGVPCSFLKPLINYVNKGSDVIYVPLNNEGEAIAFASGAYMAGKTPVVMFQNSGLGNTVNPITSLAYPFRIPLLLLCTWRGQPGLKDEPQHELMGRITSKMLSLMSVKHELLSGDEGEIVGSIKRGFNYLQRERLPYGLIVPRGLFEPDELPLHTQGGEVPKNVIQEREEGSPTLRRINVIEAICAVIGTDHVIIGTTGKTGRELYLCRDSPNHLYMVGAMGCASSFALGMAMYLPPERRVVVIDGDGAALMRMEAMVSVGYYSPSNLIHLVVDNNAYDSTGGQQTLSSGVAFEQLAAACGYAYSVSISSEKRLLEELRKALRSQGPSLIHVRIMPGSVEKPPRPHIKPHQVKERLMSYLGSNNEHD